MAAFAGVVAADAVFAGAALVDDFAGATPAFVGPEPVGADLPAAVLAGALPAGLPVGAAVFAGPGFDGAAFSGVDLAGELLALAVLVVAGFVPVGVAASGVSFASAVLVPPLSRTVEAAIPAAVPLPVVVARAVAPTMAVPRPAVSDRVPPGLTGASLAAESCAEVDRAAAGRPVVGPDDPDAPDEPAGPAGPVERAVPVRPPLARPAAGDEAAFLAAVRREVVDSRTPESDPPELRAGIAALVCFRAPGPEPPERAGVAEDSCLRAPAAGPPALRAGMATVVCLRVPVAAAATREGRGEPVGIGELAPWAAGPSEGRSTGFLPALRAVAVVWSLVDRSSAAARGAAEPFVAFAIT